MKKNILSIIVFFIVFILVHISLIHEFSFEQQTGYYEFAISEKANIFCADVNENNLLIVEQITSWAGDVIWTDSNEVFLSSVWVVDLDSSFIYKRDDETEISEEALTTEELVAFLSDCCKNNSATHAEMNIIQDGYAIRKEIVVDGNYQGTLVLKHKLSVPITLTDIKKRSPNYVLSPQLLIISGLIAGIALIGVRLLFLLFGTAECSKVKKHDN